MATDLLAAVAIAFGIAGRVISSALFSRRFGVGPGAAGRGDGLLVRGAGLVNVGAGLVVGARLVHYRNGLAVGAVPRYAFAGGGPDVGDRLIAGCDGEQLVGPRPPQAWAESIPKRVEAAFATYGFCLGEILTSGRVVLISLLLVFLRLLEVSDDALA